MPWSDLQKKSRWERANRARRTAAERERLKDPVKREKKRVAQRKRRKKASTALRKKWRDYARHYRTVHRDRIVAVQKAWRRRNPDKQTTYRLRCAYGITKEDRDAMLRRQRGRCKLCRRKPKRLSVDHCHRTGRVRGLLCSFCNSNLGWAEAVSAKKIAMYLQERA